MHSDKGDGTLSRVPREGITVRFFAVFPSPAATTTSVSS